MFALSKHVYSFTLWGIKIILIYIYICIIIIIIIILLLFQLLLLLLLIKNDFLKHKQANIALKADVSASS